MIPALILGICLLVGLVLLAQWFVNADPKALARGVRYGAAGLGGDRGAILEGGVDGRREIGEGVGVGHGGAGSGFGVERCLAMPAPEVKPKSAAG